MSHITVPDYTPEVEYAVTTASTGPFEIPFVFFDQEDIKVYTEDSDGVSTELVLTTDWTYTRLDLPVDQDGQGYEGGEITLNASVSNVTLRIYRDTGIDRLSNYPITGPFSIELLNDELNRNIMILQELERNKSVYLTLPDSAVATTPWDLSGRIAGNAGEGTGEAQLATNRQVDASGPNWVADDDAQNAVGTVDQWNPLYSASAVEIQGNETTKLFDLMTQFFSIIQNRGGNEASFYIRYRYLVDCYSEITKIMNSSYLFKVPATSSIPFSFMDISQDIDYTNGNGTVLVALDIYPVGSNSADLYSQWGNLAVNTSAPR